MATRKGMERNVHKATKASRVRLKVSSVSDSLVKLVHNLSMDLEEIPFLHCVTWPSIDPRLKSLVIISDCALEISEPNWKVLCCVKIRNKVSQGNDLASFILMAFGVMSKTNIHTSSS